jgi:hypothetical protein
MLPLLLAAAFVAPAKASWWAQDSTSFGSNSYFGNDARLGADFGNGLGMELGQELYSDKALAGVVQGFSAAGSLAFQREMLGAKAIVYPERFGSQTEALALTSTFLVNQEQEAHTQAVLGLAGARQQAPLDYSGGFSADKDLTQYAVQANIQQSYFKLFQFIVGGSYFVYDRGLQDVTRDGTTFNTSDIVWIPTVHAITPFVRYTADIEFIRLATADEPVAFFVSYSRIAFATEGFAQSGSAGVDFDMGGGFRFDPTYEYYNLSNAPWQSYVALLLRYTHE